MVPANYKIIELDFSVTKHKFLEALRIEMKITVYIL